MEKESMPLTGPIDAIQIQPIENSLPITCYWKKITGLLCIFHSCKTELLAVYFIHLPFWEDLKIFLWEMLVKFWVKPYVNII